MIRIRSQSLKQIGRGFSNLSFNGKFIKYEELKDYAVGLITLNDPKRLNPLTIDMGNELKSLVDKLMVDCSVNAIVIQGAGRAFSAGGDLDFLRDRHRFLCIRELPVPTIAAINGPAIGAGLCFALATDIRVTSEDAKLGLTFTKLGLHPGMGSTYFLKQIAGSQVSNYLCLTGRTITGKEALAMSIVLQSVAHSHEVLPAAMEIAKQCSEGGSIAVRTAVKSLRCQDDISLERCLLREADAQAQCYNEIDLINGVTAVGKKEKPVFQPPSNTLE